MNDISPENRRVIKILNALIEKRHQEYINEMPVSVVTLKHLELIDIDYFEASEIFKALINEGCIKPLSSNEYEKLMNLIYKEIEEKIQEKINDGKTSYKTVTKNSKAILKYFGIEPTNEELENDINLKDTKSYKKLITGKIEEELAKSKEIGIYKIEKDLHKIRRYIMSGRDLYNLDKDWLTFNSETQLLMIGEEPISLLASPPLNGQFLLEFILKHGSKEKYSIEELLDNDAIPDGEKRTYYDAIVNLNKRIKKESQYKKINDFMENKGGYIYIKDKYTK
jgi:hypothetical protein